VDSKEVKWKTYFGQDWPEHKTLPNRFIQNGEVISLDGLSYRFNDLGAAESNSDLLFTLGETQSVVFVGDLVFNKIHGFMNDGNSKKWLIVLHQLLTDVVAVDQIFTGHGKPGNAYKLIKEQIEYINHYRSNLCKLMSNRQLLDDEQKQLFEQLIIEKYPKYQLTSLIKAGIAGVTQELMVEQ
jgi:glyoxylase-like metal-dependent hydrolase (beta-lactamase superfamily II)